MTAAPTRAKAIATVCLSGTLEDKLIAAAHAGFDAIELFEPDLIGSPLSPAQVKQRCADLGLEIALYQPFRDFEAVPAELHAHNMRRAERKFDVMAELGADTILMCSSVSPHTIDDPALAAAQLREVAIAADRRGMRVAYEALAWGRFVNLWEQSWDIVERADHPALGLCLDSFHILSRTSEVGGIAKLPGEKIFFLQLSDAPRMDMDVLQWSRHYRLFPGQGNFDLPGFVRLVLDAGYRGPLSLEVFNDVFRQSAPVQTAVDAMRSLVALEHNLAAPVPATPAPAATPPLTPAPAATGHAFTELAASPTSADPVRRTLAALGFSRTHRHRSKPVDLWQQGAARVLLNVSSPGATPTAETSITALGVDVDDPETVAADARELLAPPLPRVVGPGESTLPAVVAPDGTSLFFCPPADAPGSWLSDFVPTGDEPKPVSGITRTEYVTLTQPFDRFDEAILFYRSILGLELADSTEYAGPFGFVRSRFLTTADGGFGVALTSSTLRRGDWAPGVPSPQHLALATDDIFASVRAMREHGAPILEIPANYYADLDARFDLDQGLLARLRDNNILYDNDENGEYFHVFTEVIGTRVFFEVVQRRGGYRGHGSVNAPVRMAAHAAVRARALRG